MAQADKNEQDWILGKVKTDGVEVNKLLKELSEQKSKFNSAGVKRVMQNIVKRTPLTKLPPPTSLTENTEVENGYEIEVNQPV